MRDLAGLIAPRHLIVVADKEDSIRRHIESLACLLEKHRGRLHVRAVGREDDRAKKLQQAAFAEAIEPSTLRRPDVGNDADPVGPGEALQRRDVFGIDIAQFEAGLQTRKRDVGIWQTGVTLKAINRLKLLDRVAFDASAHTIAHDAVEIDQQIAAQEIINLAFASRVPAHQPFQRPGFVRCVVVDVQVRILFSALVHEVHKALKDGLFALSVERPVCRAGPGAIFIAIDIAEEILKAVLTNERIALDVEENVSVRRFRQQAQADIFDDRQELVPDLASLTRLNLDAGFFTRRLLGER